MATSNHWEYTTGSVKVNLQSQSQSLLQITDEAEWQLRLATMTTFCRLSTHAMMPALQYGTLIQQLSRLEKQPALCISTHRSSLFASACSTENNLLQFDSLAVGCWGLWLSGNRFDLADR
jgi:hypothetical protein